MRSANVLNDFALKYVFGKDCKEAALRNEWTRKNDLLLFKLPLRLSGTMEVDVITSILNMSLDEIEKNIYKKKSHYLWLSLFSRLAFTKPTNNGWGRFGLDLNSGWYCTPI